MGAIGMERDDLGISAGKEPLPSDYLSEIDDEGLTESQKQELVEILFQIMKSFVLLGYGMEPVNKLIEEFQNCANAPADLLELEDDNESYDYE
tara:strand:+ start:164 stop:442 length:279 start_codon:yes stop_codon:yes gene_type:complete